MPPFPTLLITSGLVSFFIALRITIRGADDGREGIADFFKVIAYSFATAVSFRLALLILL